MPPKPSILKINDVNPFRRLVVYNSVQGTTYIFWEFATWFKDPGPYTAQLQVARTPNHNDTEWANVGQALSDPAFLTDSATKTHGMTLDKYYRIVFTTQYGTYVSPVGTCHGQLRPREWKIAKEIIRKEILRFGYTAVPVTILKKKNYGEVCPYCSDSDISGSKNSECPYCYGTGYVGGYHTPFTMQMMDISPSQLREMRHTANTTTFNVAVDKYQGRALGLPELNEGDIVVDRSTDQRFVINTSPVIAQMHRVPLVRQLEMSLLPASDITYTIPLDDEPLKSPDSQGCGSIVLNASYGDEGLLKYVDEQNNPIESASVTVYKLEDGTEIEIGKTFTTSSGDWQDNIMVDAGIYKIIFEKTGEFGPDETEITIEEPKKPEQSPPTMDEIDFLNAF